MQAILVTLYVLVALLLIGVILIQQPKSTAGLFSGSGQSLLGTSGKNFMTRFTTGLAALFMLLCVLMALLPKTQGPKSAVADLLQQQQKTSEESAAQAAAQAVSGTGSAGGSVSAAQAVSGLAPAAAQKPAASTNQAPAASGKPAGKAGN